ncbi:MAG: type IV toxin-antitoxin system AbiEi family antitoxin domain-containing protein [Methylococcales bacterium]
MGLHKDNKLNKLHNLLPEGVAVPSKWLVEQGYSRQLVRKYVQSQWLQSLGRGVYARPQSVPNWQGLVLGMQHFAHSPFHVGGVSALNLQGYAHYLPLGGNDKGNSNKANREIIHLWVQSNARGKAPAKVPAWVKAVTIAETLTFHPRQLFDEPAQDVGFESIPSGVRDLQLKVSAPERAIMEVLYDVQDDEHAFTHALELFEGLTSLRPKRVNTLLQHCRSIKVKRLFLFMVDQFSYPWIARIEKNQLDLGSGKRVIVKGGKLDKQYLITVPERRHQ